MKRRRARPEDALRYLDLALSTPIDSARRRQLLDQALLVYSLGAYWPGATIGDRRRGGRRRHDDAELVATMQKISKVTGETRHFTLARCAVDSLAPDRKNAEEESFIRRLVRAYRKASTDI